MLTVRERLRGGGDDLVNDARSAGQAIFSMKSGSPPSIIKAIRALAGIDPSPFSLRDVSAAVRLPSVVTALMLCQHPCGFLCCLPLDSRPSPCQRVSCGQCRKLTVCSLMLC